MVLDKTKAGAYTEFAASHITKKGCRIVNLHIKAIVTSVKEGEKRDYVSLVDLDNGGTFSVSVPKGTASELPKLTPVEIVARAMGGRYGLSLENYTIKKGGE